MSKTRPTSMMSVRAGAWRLALPAMLALLWLGACTPPPTEHLKLYAENASQTRTAGGAVLDRIAPIITTQAAETDDCGPEPVTRVPRCFNLSQVTATSGGRADPPEIAVHRLALDLVAAYALVLVDLAEGKSVTELQTQIGAAADIASTLASAAGVAFPLAAALPQIKALAGRLEAARAGLVIRQSLIADRQTIQAILKELESQTPRLYEIYVNKRKLDLKTALRADQTAQADAIRDETKRFHAALEAYVRLLRATSASLDTLARWAEQAAKPSPQAIQAALRQAIEARAEVQALSQTIRQIDTPSR